MGATSKYDNMGAGSLPGLHAGGRKIDPDVSRLDRDLHTSVMKRQAKLDANKAQAELGQEEQKGSSLGGLLGSTELTKEKIKSILDGDRRIYYRTQELNDKLYLHYGGYSKLANLEGFTGLKTLYAECNALETLEGLETCTQLRSLFLQENCVRTLRGVEEFKELWSLNLSSNFLERIGEEVRDLPKLNTFMAAKNRIGFNGVEDLAGLVGSHISCLDIQDNKVDDPEILPEVLMRMPNLSCLYLKGNPVCKKIPNYRKTVIASLRGLKYLDDRPVFAEDRRYAEAFNKGGIAEEREERKRFKAEKDAAHRRNMEAFRNMVENAKREKQERRAMRGEDKYTDDTDPVEDPDHRVSRLKKEWEEKNAEELKDAATEHAKKCLAQERDLKSTNRKKKKAEGGGDEGGEEDDDKEGEDEPPPLEGLLGGGGDVDPEAPNAPKKKEDNRKLQYDDIWDEVPAGSASSACAPPPSAGGAGGPAASKDLISQIWEQGEKAMKAQGMDGDDLNRLKEMKEAALKGLDQAEEEEQAKQQRPESGSTRAPTDDAEEDGVVVEEIPQATRMAIQADDDDDDEDEVIDCDAKPAAAAPKPAFAPPPRKPAASTVAEPVAVPKQDDNELDEMD